MQGTITDEGSRTVRSDVTTITDALAERIGPQKYKIWFMGSTRFAGDDRFTVNFGAGYRFILTDSISLHMDFRDHLFDIDVVGEEKTTHNLEATLGLTAFF